MLIYLCEHFYPQDDQGIYFRYLDLKCHVCSYVYDGNAGIQINLLQKYYFERLNLQFKTLN